MERHPIDLTDVDAPESDPFAEVFDALTVPINEERPWMVFAACHDEDPDLFFAPTKEQTRQALAICEICPVQEDCLEYALDARERFGVWGGTTEKQRRKMLRRGAA